MRVVVADTGPLHYLVLIEAVELLPELFGRVLVPEIVCAELDRPRTPAPVRAWLARHPAWLEPRPTPPVAALPLPGLGDGERAAIALAQTVGAALVLMDDRAGVAAAWTHGLTATGTLGVLERAAARGLVDLPAAVARLKGTNFRYRVAPLDALLARHRAGKAP